MNATWQQTLLALPVPLQREADMAFARLLEVCDDAQRAAYGALLDDHRCAQRTAKLFACSQFAAQLCRRYPDWLLTLQHSGDLDRSLSAHDFVARLHTQFDAGDNTDVLDRTLRQFRNREFLRIIWRD